MKRQRNWTKRNPNEMIRNENDATKSTSHDIGKTLLYRWELGHLSAGQPEAITGGNATYWILSIFLRFCLPKPKLEDFSRIDSSLILTIDGSIELNRWILRSLEQSIEFNDRWTHRSIDWLMEWTIDGSGDRWIERPNDRRSIDHWFTNHSYLRANGTRMKVPPRVKLTWVSYNHSIFNFKKKHKNWIIQDKPKNQKNNRKYRGFPVFQK